MSLRSKENVTYFEQNECSRDDAEISADWTMLEVTSRKKSLNDDFHDDTAGVDAFGNVRAVTSNVVPHIGRSVGRCIIAATSSICTVATNTTGNQLGKSLEGCVSGATFNNGVKCQEAEEGAAVLEFDFKDVAHLFRD